MSNKPPITLTMFPEDSRLLRFKKTNYPDITISNVVVTGPDWLVVSDETGNGNFAYFRLTIPAGTEAGRYDVKYQLQLSNQDKETFEIILDIES